MIIKVYSSFLYWFLLTFGSITIGAITTGDIVGEMSGQIHELTHGVSGFEYHNNLESARTGDGIHVPGACTDDHSYLQVHAQLFF